MRMPYPFLSRADLLFQNAEGEFSAIVTTPKVYPSTGIAGSGRAGMVAADMSRFIAIV